jgi:hypothetical protein
VGWGAFQVFLSAFDNQQVPVRNARVKFCLFGGKLPIEVMDQFSRFFV